MSATAYSAASVYIPRDAGVKAGALQAWRPDVNLLQDIDVVRAAASDVASRVNSSGVLEFVGANVPRWDWSEGGSCPSLLVEPQRTNLFDQDLDTGAPATQTITVVNGTEYTVSMRGSGTVTLTNAGTGVVSQGTHVTFTAGSTSLVCTVSASGVDYVNVEAGAYPTSIIYTSGGVATRNADAISKTGIASLIGQSEGTFYIEASVFKKTGNNAFITFNDGTDDNQVGINLDTSGVLLRGTMSVDSVLLVNKAGGSLAANTFTKIAFRFSTDFNMYQDGSSIISESSVSSYPDNTLTNFNLGLRNSSDDIFAEFYGRIRALAWYKTAFTNTELTAITTP